MLTLSDINATSNSKDGDIYSDLYKDVYGWRPRNVEFVSVEAFDEDFKYLVNKLESQLDDERARQARNFNGFVQQINDIIELVPGTTREHAIKIMAEAEGIGEEEFNFYGLESLEYNFDLKYGSIKEWLEI